MNPSTMDFNTDMNPFACNKNCLHGECVLDIDEYAACRCNEGYGGEYCDKLLEICPDGKTTCLNGSQCFANGKEYSCDCNSPSMVDIGTGVIYAGTQCEYSASSFCEYGVPSSNIAFCANGGVCKEILVDKNKKFKGCFCPDEYTGNHCEYVVSGIKTKQPWYYAITGTTKSIQNNKNDATLKGLVIFVIVTLAIVFLFVMKKTAQRTLRARKAKKQKIQFAGDRDLHLEPDGSVMPHQVTEKEIGEKQIKDPSPQQVTGDSDGTYDNKSIENVQKEESFVDGEGEVDVKKKEEIDEIFIIDELDNDDSSPVVAANQSDSFEEDKIV